jgi:hypothetical protein
VKKSGDTMTGQLNMAGANISMGSGTKIEYTTGASWIDDGSGFVGSGANTGLYQFQGPSGSIYFTGSSTQGSIVSASLFTGTASYALAGGSGGSSVSGSWASSSLSSSFLANDQPFTTVSASATPFPITASFLTQYTFVAIPNVTQLNVTFSNMPTVTQFYRRTILTISHSAIGPTSSISFPANVKWQGTNGTAPTVITGSRIHTFQFDCLCSGSTFQTVIGQYTF